MKTFSDSSNNTGSSSWSPSISKKFDRLAERLKSRSFHKSSNSEKNQNNSQNLSMSTSQLPGSNYSQYVNIPTTAANFGPNVQIKKRWKCGEPGWKKVRDDPERYREHFKDDQCDHYIWLRDGKAINSDNYK
ncbi:hypothetical protein V865_002008 [Kwoniella europaea PYCC6329]|uniref:Uncharacterized protein n=1 Tax=Kwoniella europaea PYCC6329 TaxID=1423913 RepID=A0AAX4KC39_9TREE